MNRLVVKKCSCRLGYQFWQNSTRSVSRTELKSGPVELHNVGRRAVHSCNSNTFSSARIYHVSSNIRNSLASRGLRTSLKRDYLSCTSNGPNIIESRCLSSHARHSSIWKWNGSNNAFAQSEDGSSSSSGDNGNEGGGGGSGEGSAGGNGGEGEGGGSAGGNGNGGGGEGGQPPTPPAAPPVPLTVSLPASLTVPETFTPVPVIAVERSPVFPKFIKIVEVS